MKPFIHKYKTKNALYIYDINSNKILKVTPIIYNIVDDIGVLAQDNIVDKWKKSYPKNEIMEALNLIRDYQERGFFQKNKLLKLSPPLCEECLDGLLNFQQLILNVTERCNLRCKYCLYSGLYPYERTHSYKIMDAEIMVRAIDYFLNHTQGPESKEISFYGGEPLMAWELIKEAIKHIKKRTSTENINFHIDTNGTCFSDEILRFIIQNKIFLQISIDGPQWLHDRYRNFDNEKGSFNIIMQNLQRIRELDEDYYKTHVRFAVTLAPPYALSIRDEFFTSEMFAGHLISPTFVQSYDTQFFDKYYPNSNDDLSTEIEELKIRYINSRINNTEPTGFQVGFFERPLIRIHTRSLQPLDKIVPANGICVPGKRRLFVTTNGDFYPCERVGNAFYLGNVRMGLDTGKVLSLIQHYIEISVSDCIQCWAVRLCSLCFASAREGDRLSINRKRQNCSIERKTIADALVTYTTILEQNPRAFDFVKEMKFG